MVRIPRSHRGDRGSIPLWGKRLFVSYNTKEDTNIALELVLIILIIDIKYEPTFGHKLN